MLGRFLEAEAKGAELIARILLLDHIICSEYFVMHNKQDKELTLVFSIGVPNLRSREGDYRPIELTFISRGNREPPIGSPLSID
jgi:hypothetical protein